MQNIFYHNNSESSAFTGALNQKEVHRAITLHPIKKTPYMYRLHAYIKVGTAHSFTHKILLVGKDV